MGPTSSSAVIQTGKPQESPADTQAALCHWKEPSPRPSSCLRPFSASRAGSVSSILHSPPSPPPPGISLQVIWGYGHSSGNMMMKHLCFHYILSFPAVFNVLYIPVWLLFLFCLSFIELVNANHFWDVINLLPADKMSVRQEGAWVLACVLWAQTACSQQSCPAVHTYSCNKQVDKRVADLHLNNGKK